MIGRKTISKQHRRGGIRMKTFKLVSLQVIEDSRLQDIKLIDGLIINKENEDSFWIIEAFMSRSYEAFFQSLFQQKKHFTVQTVITKQENDPAPFEATIRSICLMNERMNVVMKGKLINSRNEYVELLLEQLVNEGLSGKTLIQAFKDKLRLVPRIVASQPTSKSRHR